MSVKDNIDKQLTRAAEDVAAAQKAAKADPAPPAADPELDIQLAAVKGGYIKAAYRTRNGALVVTR